MTLSLIIGLFVAFDIGFFVAVVGVNHFVIKPKERQFKANLIKTKRVIELAMLAAQLSEAPKVPKVLKDGSVLSPIQIKRPGN